MISIDGLRPAEYLQPESCGTDIPTLRELMRVGVYAQGVTGVLPTLTYPSHATLVTGTYPTKHGVLNNARPTDGARWHFDRSDIHAATLWDAARRAGLSTAIVTWPSSYGADVDHLIPENLSYGPDGAELIRAGSTPGLFESLEATAGSVRLLPFSDPEAGTPLDEMTSSFSAAVVSRYRPNLLLVHFLDLDHRQHSEGVGSEEACRALRRIDGFIAQIRSAYRDAGILDQTAFFIVSDHGFFPVHTRVDVGALLAESGWSALSSAPVDQTLEVRPAGGSTAVYLRSGVDASLLQSLEAELRPQLESRFRGLLRWLTPDAAERLGGFPGAAFVLCASPGYVFALASPTPDSPFASSEPYRGMHGYCPDEPGIDAAFIASGSGIRALGAIPPIRMIDIGPSVAALLGINLADADGIAVAGILRR